MVTSDFTVRLTVRVCVCVGSTWEGGDGLGWTQNHPYSIIRSLDEQLCQKISGSLI